MGTFIEHLNKEEQRLLGLLDAVRKLKDAYNNPVEFSVNVIPSKSSDNDKTPVVYSKDLSQRALTLFALEKIGTGYVNELVSCIVNEDSTLDAKRVKDFVTFHSSKLYKEGKIKATKVGNKNRYSI
jgi:hypothetical protein